MKEWDIDFIARDKFKEHVTNTLKNYVSNLKQMDLKQFNDNIIDPIKLLFDKAVCNASWDEIIKREIDRQRDKSNNNDIGYFHQNIFKYMKNCTVTKNGVGDGWDVIYKNTEGIILPHNDSVKTVYVEMKNKYNTMNSSSSAKTYTKMQKALLKDDECACFLVEAIARKSQNIIWETTVEKEKRSHKRIRRVSIDEFYKLVTGEEEAFFKICMQLPEMINEVMNENALWNVLKPQDTALEEIKEKVKTIRCDNEEDAFVLAIFLLGFPTYYGFNSIQ